MTKFRTIVTAAAAVGLSLMAAGVVMAVPADGTATGHGSDATDRVSLAFVSLPAGLDIDPALEAAAGRAAKGDFAERPGCFGQVWPDITAECLSKVSGSVSLPVRTVTLGYQVGQSTTVLVRTPAPEVASR